MLLGVMFLTPSSVFCQIFNKVEIPPDVGNFSWGHSIEKISSDSFLLATNCDLLNIPNGKIILQIINGNGTILTSKNLYGIFSNAYFLFKSNLILKNKNFYLFSKELGPTNASLSMLKLNNRLDTVYFKTFIGNYFLDFICAYDDGQNFIVTGSEYPTGGPAYKLAVLKIDYNGNLIWKKNYSENAQLSYLGFNTVNAPNGGYFTSCNSDQHRTGNTLDDGYVSIYRLDSNGNKLWKKKLWRNLNSLTVRIREDGYGQYYVGSTTDSLSVNNNKRGNTIIAKIDTAGNILWQKVFDEILNRDKSLWDYQVLINKTILVYGTTSGNSVQDVGWVAQVDTNGTVLWQNYFKSFAGSDFGWLSDAVQLDDGGYILTGCARDSATNKQGIWLLRIDACGNLLPNCTPLSTVAVSVAPIDVLVYPNPASDYLQIASSGNTSLQGQISLIDINGRQVYSSKISANKSSLDVSNYASGVYLLRFEGVNGQVVCKRWVKE
jgi:hypothetical protein